MSNFRDTRFAAPPAGIGLFTFDDRVAPVYADMIRRPLRGYPAVVTPQ